MTDDRSLERAARSWLEAGRPRHLIAPSRPPSSGSKRHDRNGICGFRGSCHLSIPARLAAVAIVGVLLLAGDIRLRRRSSVDHGTDRHPQPGRKPICPRTCRLHRPAGPGPRGAPRQCARWLGIREQRRCRQASLLLHGRRRHECIDRARVPPRPAGDGQDLRGCVTGRHARRLPGLRHRMRSGRRVSMGPGFTSSSRSASASKETPPTTRQGHVSW